MVDGAGMVDGVGNASATPKCRGEECLVVGVGCLCGGWGV